MKTVSGEVVSCESVSLSKAARILSKFAFSDNGASPAYAAYLKRASASFDQLAQLHKELKSSGSYKKVKKGHSHGVVTDGTVDIGSSKRKEGCGVNVDQETERDSLGRSAMSMQVHKVEEIVERNVGDGDVGGGGAGKKSKKKRESNQTKIVTIKDEFNGDCDGSKVSKKKKKRGKHENEKHDVAVKIEKEVHSHEDHKKKHKKKRTREGKERVDEGNVQIEAANDRENRKRKHESVATEGLEGSSEQHKSKKKKR